MQQAIDPFLVELAEKLQVIRHRRLATQTQIEADTGIDQTTISRASALRRRRITPQLRDLMKYANMLIEPRPIAPGINQAVNTFLRVGGSEAELIESIEHAARLVARRVPSDRN